MRVKLSDISANSANPRILKDNAYAALKRSVAQFPRMLAVRGLALIRDEGGKKKWTTLGGNQRYRIFCDLKKEIDDPGFAERYGTADENIAILRDYFANGVPAHDCTGFTDAEAARFVVADNVAAGEWDTEALANGWDVDDLADWGLNLGWDAAGETSGEAHEDDYDAPAIEEITTDIKDGDFFEIGEHRLLCGDSTSMQAWERLMGDDIADLYLSDPPYGVSYEGKTKNKLKIKNYALTEDQTHDLFSSSFDCALSFLRLGGSVYATVPAGLLQLGFMRCLHERGVLRQCMVWNKSSMVLGHSDYHYKHEPILYGWKPGASHHFTKDRTKTTVFDFDKPQRNDKHPTMKPVALWAEMIQNSTVSKNIVIDPFCGSGTTLIACEQLGRRGFGIEIDPKYCQVIFDRMMHSFPELEVQKNGEKYQTSP